MIFHKTYQIAMPCLNIGRKPMLNIKVKGGKLRSERTKLKETEMEEYIYLFYCSSLTRYIIENHIISVLIR